MNRATYTEMQTAFRHMRRQVNRYLDDPSLTDAQRRAVWEDAMKARARWQFLQQQMEEAA